MVKFLDGVVLENEIGAEYEGSVFTRYMKIELDDGHELPLFDYHCIGETLLIGSKYSFVLVPLIKPGTLKKRRSLAEEVSRIHVGIVVSTAWSPPQDFPFFSRDLYKDVYDRDRKWVLVRTHLGHILISQAAFGGRNGFQVIEDDWLEWAVTRTDLVAVADTNHPEPG